MKKFKLLIPAMSIASVAAITTPLLAACDPYVQYNLSFDTFVDSAQKEYTTKYEAIGEKQFQTQSSMAESYFNAVKSDPNIFADDMIYTIAKKYVQPYQSQTVSVSNTQIIKDIMLNGDRTTVLSFQFNINQKLSGGSTREIISFNLTNVPYKFIDKTVSPTLVTTIMPYMYLLLDDSATQEQKTIAKYVMTMADFKIQMSYKNYSINTEKQETLKTDITVEAKNLDEVLILLSNSTVKTLSYWLRQPISTNYYKSVHLIEK